MKETVKTMLGNPYGTMIVGLAVALIGSGAATVIRACGDSVAKCIAEAKISKTT